MDLQKFIEHCHQLTGNQQQDATGPDSLIGLFQCFRPDGKESHEVFQDEPKNKELVERLEQLYSAAGDDRRPDGGRDAYFVVRRPATISPQRAETLASKWLCGLRSMAEYAGLETALASISTEIKIRVLEGIPPKHPKNKSEQATLLQSIQTCGEITDQIEIDLIATALRPAYYFIACDPMLRDYLMWPFYREKTNLEDPFEPYFQLWKCGVKYRIFEETQIDLYLPRQLAS